MYLQGTTCDGFPIPEPESVVGRVDNKHPTKTQRMMRSLRTTSPDADSVLSSRTGKASRFRGTRLKDVINPLIF